MIGPPLAGPAAVALSFAAGAVPFGWLVGRLHGVDLLDRGSGTTGATNVYHHLGLWKALWVLVLDVGKGTAAIALAWSTGPQPGPLLATACGIAAMTGHSWSPILWALSRRWTAGRSVATALGSLLVLSPPAAAVALAAWTAGALVTRRTEAAVLIALPASLVTALLAQQLRPGSPAAVVFDVAIVLFLPLRSADLWLPLVRVRLQPVGGDDALPGRRSSD